MKNLERFPLAREGREQGVGEEIPFGSEETISFVFQRKESIFIDKELPQLLYRDRDHDRRVGIHGIYF